MDTTTNTNSTRAPHQSGTAGAVPPSGAAPGTSTTWPSGAKALVTFLAIALIGAVVAAIAFATGDDGSAEQQRLRDEVAAVAEERDGAIVGAEELDAELAEVRADNVTLTEQNEELGAAVEELDEQVAASEEALATAETDLATMTAERDVFLELFPIEFDATLAELDLVGDHEVDLTELYCSGLSTCGSLPAIGEMTISRTEQGWLQLSIPDIAEGALIRADGALHMVVASPNAVPQCAGVDRAARVTMTLLPGSYAINADGTQTVAAVTGVLTVAAPETDTCGPATAFYSVQLTPTA